MVAFSAGVSLRSKRFQLSSCAKFRAEAKKKKGPLPLPRHFFFFFCSRFCNFLDELARKHLLRRLRRRILEAIDVAGAANFYPVYRRTPPLLSPLRAGGICTQATNCNSENRGRFESSRGRDQ